MIAPKRREDCCGCNACADACPHSAISFEPDAEGFLYPKVDGAKCIGCGLCDKVCPMLCVEEMRRAADARKPEFCAAINRDREVRFDSTSGGVFSALAAKTFEAGGFVGGAVWGEGFAIEQMVTDDAADLPRLRSSKYAQSDARGFYKAVKSAVDTGRPVLVCGTPCQMVALRAYIGSEKDNLTVVDFVCRGSNSPLVMRKYVEMAERLHGSRVTAIKQKSKELGWHRLTTKFTFADGAVWYDPVETSYFMRGYLYSNAFCRPSCYECRFKGFPRLADISLADCWTAVEGLEGEFNNDTGTSLVVCNTGRGKAVLDSISDVVETRSVDAERAVAGNQAMIKSLARPSESRETFFDRMNSLPFEESMASVKPSFSGGRRARIKRWIKSLFGNPYLTKRGRVVIERHKGAKLEIEGPLTIGASPYRKSKLESRLLLRSGSAMLSRGGDISYGCDIELFKDARLEIGSGFYANIGTEIICAESVKIGDGVTLGRHVTIRDTNGGHVVNSQGYRDCAPVEIGDHVWLCEGVKVMPGVRIGSGTVVAAGAVVTKDLPANVLAAGVPAKVVRTGVQWKR